MCVCVCVHLDWLSLFGTHAQLQQIECPEPNLMPLVFTRWRAQAKILVFEHCSFKELKQGYKMTQGSTMKNNGGWGSKGPTAPTME